jgi:hypothetical protein
VGRSAEAVDLVRAAQSAALRADTPHSRRSATPSKRTGTQASQASQTHVPRPALPGRAGWLAASGFTPVAVPCELWPVMGRWTEPGR